MNRKNSLLLVFIGLIILAVGTFFVIKLARDTIFVYEESPLSTETFIELRETTKTDETTPDLTLAAEMDEIETQVSQLRGLSIETAIPRRLMPRDELHQVVLNDFLEDYQPEDEKRDVTVMHLFGFLPIDFQLRDFYLDLYAEQIAGYYDSESKAMFVISDSGFGGMERSTYAHEFVHTLQDEHFNFDGSLDYNDDACKKDTERCMAIQSLIEGDAVLTEQLWFQNYSSSQDMKDLQEFAATFKSPVYDSAPASLKEDLTFPYLYGSKFVQALYAQGGYDAIDTAFTTTNPVSTEQIMHPAAYPSDVPNNPTLSDLENKLGIGWSEIDNNTLGEWYVYLVLAKAYDPQFRLYDSLALDAAEGWGGDVYSVFQNEQTGQVAAMISFNWDTKTDADAAFEAFNAYSDLRFGTVQPNGYRQNSDFFSLLHQTGSTSFVWLLAQDLATLQLLQDFVEN